MLGRQGGRTAPSARAAGDFLPAPETPAAGFASPASDRPPEALAPVPTDPVPAGHFPERPGVSSVVPAGGVRTLSA
jgi:hypothetical protein